MIREPIVGGNGQITGNFTVEEANDLSLLLRAGALPAPMKILEERTVGPDLGADSIEAGKIACIIGLAAVILFMALYYGLFGLVADLALLLNLIIMLGVLSLLQATLTLPGIAGIVLTIGMAVDANVLIFERIREEARAGRAPFSAMEAGYRRAFTTIIDSNLTTLIAAIILFVIGTGPVKGFAVTLGIGIATSMFTAMLVSRMILVAWLRQRRPAAAAAVGFASMWRFRLIPDKTKRSRSCCSAAPSSSSRSRWRCSRSRSCSGRGLNFGIDFAGGILIEVGTEREADIGQMRSALTGLGLGEIALQEFGSPTEVLIRIERQPGDAGVQQVAVTAVREALSANYSDTLSYRQGRDRGAQGGLRADPGRHHRGGGLGLPDAGLHLVPIRAAVRHRRGDRADTRRAALARNLRGARAGI